MSEHAQKCENYAIIKQNSTPELLIDLKMAYSCIFGLRGNLNFPDFLQKKFYNINYRNMEKNIDISHTHTQTNKQTNIETDEGMSKSLPF